MEAVATNIGVDASKLSLEKKNKKKERSRSPRREPLPPVKFVKRGEAGEAAPVKSEVPDVKQESPGGDMTSENGVKHEQVGENVPDQQQPLQPPPTLPAESFSQPTNSTVPGAGGAGGAGVAGAQNKAQQIELEKKLMEQGEPATLKQQEDMSIKGKSARQMVMQRLMGSRAKVESVVLLLKNMVTSEEVDETLQEEIEEECNRYGKVENVIIYQERQSEEADAEVKVKIFVEFSQHEEVKQAQSALDGRFFGGRTVSAIVYDQDLYNQQDFSA